MKKTLSLLIILITFAFSGCTSPAANDNGTDNVTEGLYLALTFSGTSSNARAVYIWVEDDAGNYVDTIQQYYGEPGNYYPLGTVSGRWDNDRNADWTGSVNEDFGTNGTLVVDGITSASIHSSTYTSAIWDRMDASGSSIVPGTYNINIEISYHNNAPYTASRASGDLTIGSTSTNADMSITVANGDLLEVKAFNNVK